MSKSRTLTANRMKSSSRDRLCTFAATDSPQHSRQSLQNIVSDNFIGSNGSYESALLEDNFCGAESDVDLSNGTTGRVNDDGGTRSSQVSPGCSFTSDSFQVPNHNEESEKIQLSSLEKLADFKEGKDNDRTSTSLKHYPISGQTSGSTGNRALSTSVAKSRVFQAKSKLPLLDDDVVMMPGAASELFRSITSGGPPTPTAPGLFHRKILNSISAISKGNSLEVDDLSLPVGLVIGRQRHQPLLLQRDQLTDSLAWFSSHVPRCVMQDLASNELLRLTFASDEKNFGEELDIPVERPHKIKTKTKNLLDGHLGDDEIDREPSTQDDRNLELADLIDDDSYDHLMLTTCRSSAIKMNDDNNVGGHKHFHKMKKATLKKPNLLDDDSGHEAYYKQLSSPHGNIVNEKHLEAEKSKGSMWKDINESEGESKELRPTLLEGDSEAEGDLTKPKSGCLIKLTKIKVTEKNNGLAAELIARRFNTQNINNDDFAADGELTGRRSSQSDLMKPSKMDDQSNCSFSSLSDEEIKAVKLKDFEDGRLSRIAADIVSSVNMPKNMLPLPYTVKRDCALLFVDITGFTKLSTILDVEDLSKVINAYFRMIVDEVVKYGGDILKFAGDAFFAEWRVTSKKNDNVPDETAQRERMLRDHPLSRFRQSFDPTFDGKINPEMENRSLTECVFFASMCAASIVEKYSDFNVPQARDLSISFGKDQQCDAMLNVHCGVGVGELVGLHVGDYTESSVNQLTENRREYLFLGNPIDQVSKAADVAVGGQVLASPEAMRYLNETCEVPGDMLHATEPVLIASRHQKFIVPKLSSTPSATLVSSETSQLSGYASLIGHCKALDQLTLSRLHRQLILYVHPVVRGDDIAVNNARSADASQNRHRAEAELRAVYTMFVKAIMSPTVTGIHEEDKELYTTLQSIMQVTCRELDKYRGHLRQFIVDDKGVVLIATFGLRGSTFANMIADFALPATFALHAALKSELNIENRIGATIGKVYCGVVGGIRRHEFAVMGAGVNLAARLMYSPKNNGILVDESVQAHANTKFAFKSLPPVEAKGYDHPVIIFEPLHAVPHKKRGNSHDHIGRRRDVDELTGVAKRIMEEKSPSQTIMAFVIGESGMGKTALGNCVCDEAKKYAREGGKRVIIARSTSTETEQRIPLSSFKKIFLSAIKELCLHDGTLSMLEGSASKIAVGSNGRAFFQTSRRGSNRISPRRRMSTGLSLARGRQSIRPLHRLDDSGSMTSMRSQINGNVPYLQKLCDICEELKYPYAFAEIVGSQLLGLEGVIPPTHVEGHVPTIDEVVDFLTTTYIRLTGFSDLIIIFLDDFQWIDSLTWKVIRVLCQRGQNILLMGAMRSHETQSLRRMSSVGAWHGEMQSRILEFPLGPLNLSEVKEAISKVLGYKESMIDDSFCLNIYQRTGGLPVYAIDLLECIKRKKTVAIDEESGMLRWTTGAQSEQDRIGSNSVAIELSFLERFDALDVTVRRVLQSCAVLGISFFLSDVIRVHPELEEIVIVHSLNFAVDELILIEDVEDEEGEDISLWTGEESMMDHSNATWHAVDERFFQFSHAMWRKSVLDAMLKEQKVHLHRLIAEAIESEQVLILESSDIGRLLTLFDNWKSCGNFLKAAPLALAVGLRLEEWDLAAQSLDVYRDALEMCYESADRADDEEEMPRTDNELWLHASAPTSTLDFILRLHIRIATCHAQLGEQDLCATTFEDAYKIISTSTEVTRFNSELLIPIISGLCTIAVQHGSFDKESVAEQKELVIKFVEESERHEDVCHVCRALAVEADFHARLGQFDCALRSTARLLNVYDVAIHSAAIRDDYGKDYAAKACANSTEWFMLVGDIQGASSRADFVITSLLPNFDPTEIDTIMELAFPVLMVLNALGRSAVAEAALFNNIINPFHDFGGSNSFWLQFFNPFAYLMEVIKIGETGLYDLEMLSEIEQWAVNGENSIFAPELQRRGNRIVGEICCRLSKQKLDHGENADALLERGRMLLARVAFVREVDQSDLFLIQEARKMYDCMEEDTDGEASEIHQNERNMFDTECNVGTLLENFVNSSTPELSSHGVASSSDQPHLKEPNCCSCTVM